MFCFFGTIELRFFSIHKDLIYFLPLLHHCCSKYNVLKVEGGGIAPTAHPLLSATETQCKLSTQDLTDYGHNKVALI